MHLSHFSRFNFWVRIPFVFVLSWGLASCSHSPKTEDSAFQPSPEWIVSGDRKTNVEKVVVSGVELQVTDFDFPVRVNSAVEKWVDYFAGHGRRYFELYLGRSKYFIPYIIPILKEKGLPQDLVYLAMIESGFHNHARSRARAVGPWQFIKATGNRYGLHVDWWIDERRDIRKSTVAAATHLQDLYERFQSWELAAAAYNAGERKVSRAIRRYGTNDYWSLVRHRFLRPETRNYVPKIIAAAIVAKNRTQFGFPEDLDIREEAPAQPDVKENQLALPEVPEGELDDILQTYEKDYVANSGESKPGQKGELPAKLVWPLESPDQNDRTIASQSGFHEVATPKVSKHGELTAEQLAYFEVHGPADLLRISQASDVDYKTLKHLNPEIKRWCTPPHRDHYIVKLPLSAKKRFLSVYNHPAYPREVEFRKYKVRRGDTLRRIARRFGIWMDPIKDLNNIRSSRQLRRGSMIKLPLPVDRSRSISSLDLRDPPRKRARRYKKKNRRTSAKVSYNRKAAKTKKN